MTVAEALKMSGLTDAEIATLDAKVVTGLTTIVSTASADREAAELAQRGANDMFNDQITPALNAWGNKEANLTAERDYYKQLAAGAKAGGFVADAPPFTPPTPRADDGKFVANTNQVPGSPDFKVFESQVAGAIGNLADLQWKYRTIYGKEMPDSPTSLGAEATANRMSMPAWAAKKYDFAGREATIAKEAQQKSDDAIRKEASEARDKYWAERSGNNPNVRQGEASRFSDLSRGVKDGTRTDPLKLTREQRHQQTSNDIRADVAANATIQ